jgi:DNA-binding NtrC family response regulator
MAGMETILVVEDDEGLRSLMQHLFKQWGYDLLVAPTAEDALRTSAEHAGPIDLVITDVVLPRLNGPELATRLREARPGLKVLFTSGYSGDMVAAEMDLPAGATFLQKPFTVAGMLRVVRDVLSR